MKFYRFVLSIFPLFISNVTLVTYAHYILFYFRTFTGFSLVVCFPFHSHARTHNLKQSIYFVESQGARTKRRNLVRKTRTWAVKNGNPKLLGNTLEFSIAFSSGSTIVGNKLQQLMYLWVHKRKLNFPQKKKTSRKNTQSWYIVEWMRNCTNNEPNNQENKRK